MSPCLLLYALAALAGLTLGGPAAWAATVLLVAALVTRHLVTRHLVTRHLVTRHLVTRHLVTRHRPAGAAGAG